MWETVGGFPHRGARDLDVVNEDSEAFMTDITALDPRWQALIRSVSKVGDFDLAEAAVDELSEILSDQEAVTLYVAIRDHSHRQEYEWRDEFIAAFPDSEPLLPAPLPRRRVAVKWIDSDGSSGA